MLKVILARLCGVLGYARNVVRQLSIRNLIRGERMFNDGNKSEYKLYIVKVKIVAGIFAEKSMYKALEAAHRAVQSETNIYNRYPSMLVEYQAKSIKLRDADKTYIYVDGEKYAGTHNIKNKEVLKILS